MFRYLFKRDTIFATIAVFLVMGLLALVPFNTHVLDPFKLALQDFDYNDIAFSKLQKNDRVSIDPDIVVVDIDTASRADLARYLVQLSAFRPRVTGIDAIFEHAKDPVDDAMLAATMSGTPNLVVAYSLEEKEHHVEGADLFMSTQPRNRGYVNFVGEDSGVIRYTVPSVHEGGQSYYSFAAALARVADPAAFATLEKRGHDVEIINYERRGDHFFVLDAADLSRPGFDTALLRNKIVLLAEVSDNPYYVEDRHFTPLNSRFVGKSVPDMNGVFIHANILRMILDHDYIGRVPNWINWLIAVVLCWLMTAFFIHFYLDRHLWFHLAAKGAQLLFAIIFVYLGLMFFARWHLKINLTGTLVAVILVVDVLYFYEALSVWLHKKTGYKTIFFRQHH